MKTIRNKYFYGRTEEKFYKDFWITIEDYPKSGVVAAFNEIEKASGGVITKIYEADNLCHTIDVEIEFMGDTEEVRSEEQWEEECHEKAVEALREIRKLDFVEGAEFI